MRLRRKPWMDRALPEVLGTYLLRDGLEAYKGKWRQLFPDKDLSLEIGCGKGRFTVGMARLFPQRVFLAMESQREVAFYPARAAKVLGLDNLRVLWADAAHLEDYFAPEEIKTLYLNFSDPWPKARHAKRRLTHRSFLQKYAALLGPGGKLFFKTDNRGLFDFSLEEFAALGLKVSACTYDLARSPYPNPVQSEYEEKFTALGHPINYCEVDF